jgi:hypothetical protein
VTGGRGVDRAVAAFGPIPDEFCMLLSSHSRWDENELLEQACACCRGKCWIMPAAKSIIALPGL